MSNYAHNQILCIGPEDEIDKIRTMVVKAIKLAECIMADKKDSINRAEHHLFQQLIPIPDDYDFIIPKKGENVSVSASEAYKIIGNAVPPLLAYHIAKRIEENWQRYFGG